MWKILYVIGYPLLVGPPRAIHIKASAVDSGGELADKPLWLVIIAELIVRGGMFLVIGATIESTIGEAVFETYHFDMFLGALIVCGTTHTAGYAFCFVVLADRLERAQRLYRLIRNMCYAVIPAFPVAAFLLIVQDVQRFRFEDPNIIQYAFALTWALFMIAGLIEGLSMKRKPRGMGEDFLKHLSKC